MISLASLRSQLKQQRLNLPLSYRQQADADIFQQLLSLPKVQQAQHVGAYYPLPGEVNLLPFIAQLQALGKQCYLPVVQEAGLLFRAYHPTDPGKLNRYGIFEPSSSATAINLSALDCVLIPMLGFNRAAYRIGMGGGYYDRSFSFKLLQPQANPYLIGLAYASQAVMDFVPEAWDVPMQCIITERSII